MEIVYFECAKVHPPNKAQNPRIPSQNADTAVEITLQSATDAHLPKQCLLHPNLKPILPELTKLRYRESIGMFSPHTQLELFHN